MLSYETAEALCQRYASALLSPRDGTDTGITILICHIFSDPRYPIIEDTFMLHGSSDFVVKSCYKESKPCWKAVILSWQREKAAF